ncbi:MAG: hypothetical protein ACE5IF_01785 [Candidatus Bathyarchaeia archaeon]
MVSWSFAFKKGAIIFLWSIVWGIIGGIISMIIGFAGMMGMLGAIATGDPAQILTAFMGAMGAVIAGAVIGGIITWIGIFATLVKKIVETVQELK